MGQPVVSLFADELRHARIDAGLTQEALAKLVHFSTATVSMVEQCRRQPGAQFTRSCDEVLKTNGRLERLRQFTAAHTLMPWFQQWAAIEREAERLCSFDPLLVPGLLQTEEYARAVFVGAGHFFGDALEQQVSARMARQEILTGATPPHAIFVIDEGVLRRPVGGATVMREQLERLLEVAEWPPVTLQVVPTTAGAYPGLHGYLAIASVPGDDDVAYMDNYLQGSYAQQPTDVRRLLNSWEAVRAEAFSAQHSVAVIKEALQTWT